MLNINKELYRQTEVRSNCHQQGHYSSNCPGKTRYSKESGVLTQQGILRPGAVKGKEVPDILLDTGCSWKLVHNDLVGVTIRSAHGDTALYPLAQVQVQIDGHTIDVEVAMSNSVLTSVLLGTYKSRGRGHYYTCPYAL